MIYYDTRISISGSSAIKNIACTVVNTATDVPMWTFNRSVLPGIGNTIGNTDFTIPLDCQSNVRVNLSISAGANGAFDSSRGIINLDTTSGTDAQGIAVQILYKCSGLALDTSTFISEPIGLGIRNIPLEARYYQTNDTVTAGTANATATFTLTYN
ncbi:MAG TPA: fimbrial protein [Buttiauxella sp.]